MKFIIRRSEKALVKSKIQDSYYFILVARNGECIATSEMYATKQGAEKGIIAVRKTLFAKVVDEA